MIFAHLNPKKAANRVQWSKEETEDLSEYWREMLSTDGLSALCYDVGDNKLLVSIQRGWHAHSVKDFLLQQPQVAEVEWDSVKYRRPRKRKASSTKKKS